MGTLTALLNLSQNSLEANQAALNITSNNVANANTSGYTDEIASWQENDTVRLSANSSAGEGASVTAISQRNLVLNQQVNNQTQLEASSAAESTALSDLQSIFGITTTSTTAASTTLGTDMNAFFSSLSALEASPSDSSARQNVLSAAKTLATDFNAASSQITQQNAALNQQVLGDVSEVNSLTSSIAALNLQIEANSPNSDAGTLEDQRQQDLTQLSQYIGFSQTKTENNGLTLTTATGQVLVSEGQSYALSTTNVGNNGNLYATGGYLDVITSSGQDITSDLDGTVSGAITGGSLGGVLKARDQDLPTVSSKLDQLAYLLSKAVNTQNTDGVDANGNAGGWIFTTIQNVNDAAGTLTVAITDPNAIAAAGVGEGTSGSTNATALAAIANTPIQQLNNQTPSQFYASLLTQVGDMVSSVSNENTTQKASLTQLTTQQSSLSSVSLDQEAANLTQYERSYEAASKVFSIVDALMATALNLGVETSVT
jgi:flagellar hook-associated protein 1 FlgK